HRSADEQRFQIPSGSGLRESFSWFSSFEAVNGPDALASGTRRGIVGADHGGRAGVAEMNGRKAAPVLASGGRCVGCVRSVFRLAGLTAQRVSRARRSRPNLSLA